jgi:hypothetical protein
VIKETAITSTNIVRPLTICLTMVAPFVLPDSVFFVSRLRALSLARLVPQPFAQFRQDQYAEMLEIGDIRSAGKPGSPFDCYPNG